MHPKWWFFNMYDMADAAEELQLNSFFILINLHTTSGYFHGQPRVRGVLLVERAGKLT